jgi:hypothetical protein
LQGTLLLSGFSPTGLIEKTKVGCGCSKEMITPANPMFDLINIFIIAFYHEHHSIPDIIFSILAFLQ